METLQAHVFSNLLKGNQILHLMNSEGVQGQLREAAGISGIEYKEINLPLVYPMDIEELFRDLPDIPGIIVISGYDKADAYIQDLINFTILYYEYRVMITSKKGIVPVSSKWKFVLITEPRYWFSNKDVFRKAYHLKEEDKIW